MNNSPSTNKQLIAQAEWLSAIGEPNRLTIIRALATGENVVTELAKILGVEMANVSHHLKNMKNAGVVTVKRDGRFMRYSVLGAEAIAKEIVLTHESGMRVIFTPSGEHAEEPGPKKTAAKSKGGKK